ncbi:MAG TPA: biotin/lipoyl-binding protein, partial [Flavisolibacter sp.]
MKHLALITLFALLHTISWAHGGDDHGAEKKAAALSTKYFSSEAHSDKYEILIKHGELDAGKEGTLQLFLSDARTNRALDSATITVKVLNNPALNFTLSRTDTGVYRLNGAFPANGIYDFQVAINSPSGPDFLQVSKIEVGKKLEAVAAEEHAHWYDRPWLWAVIGLLFGIIGMYLVMRSRYRKISAAIIVLVLLVPTGAINPTSAHGGDDHGKGGTAAGGGLSTSFLIEKESQFLFGILTQQTGGGSFYQSAELLGTVAASPQGRAVIQTPQTGKIVSLRVTPGQRVSKGQTLAIVEQQVEAGTQIDIIAQRNTLNAEVKAAKAQYDRLSGIADIAAKKDVTE